MTARPGDGAKLDPSRQRVKWVRHLPVEAVAGPGARGGRREDLHARLGKVSASVDSCVGTHHAAGDTPDEACLSSVKQRKRLMQGWSDSNRAIYCDGPKHHQFGVKAQGHSFQAANDQAAKDQTT